MQFAKNNSAKSTITSMKTFHTAGLDELLLLTCPYAIGLLGLQTSFSRGMYEKGTVYKPPLPHDVQELW
jgi:hypothetical protein